MRIPLHFFFVLAVLSLCFSLQGQSQHRQFDLVSPPKDEPWSRIHGMVQDSQGFLWLATVDGLFKYDGYKCTRYHNEPTNPHSLASNWVESIAVGSDGFLLLGTYGAGLDRFDLAAGSFTHYRYNPKDAATLSNDTVTAIVKDLDGLFWIGTHNGLNRFDPKTGKFTRYKNDPRNSSTLSDNQVRVLFVDRKGVLWVGTKSPWVNDGGTRVGGLNRYDPRTGKFVRYMHEGANPQSLVDNQITAIFEDSRGTFWVGTAGDGLHTMNRSKGLFERHPYDPTHPEKLSRPPVHNVNTASVTDYITFISEDQKGKIWIGTLNGGINVYDYATKVVAYYGSENNSKEKINDNRFGAAYRTRDGIFWVASQGGNLYKVNPHKISLPYFHLGKVVADFYEDDNGQLWLATDQGILLQKKNREMQQFLIEKGGFSLTNVITDLEGDSQRNLWIGTLGGLYRFHTGMQTFTGFRHEPDRETTLISDTITSLSKTKNNALWVGTANGLDWMELSSGKFKHYRNDPKEPTSLGSVFLSDEGVASVWGTTISSDNTLWMCVGGSINRFDEQTGNFQKYSIADVVVNCLKKDDKGDLWAGTSAGLYKYDRDANEFLAFHDLLRTINRNTDIFDITEDRHHNLWLKTKNEFIQLNTAKKEASVYASREHSFGWFSRKSYTTSKGEILSGDTSGYFAFNPDTLFRNIPPPSILLTSFSLADEPVKLGPGKVLPEPVYQTNHIRLKYNQNVFSIEFTSIDFTGNSEERNFLFQLENYDKKWHKADAEQTANYYNVPPGNYTFKVKVANSNGIWAEKQISVLILPPWWTTWWAYCLYGLLLIAAVYMVIRRQKQKVIEAERRRAADRELAQAKEIEKAYKELKATQAQLIQSEKMASLGELTAGIAHEIQNPLNFVNNFSAVNKELLSEMKEEMEKGNFAEVKVLVGNLEANEDKISHHGRRADNIVKGMLQHARSSTGMKEATNINKLADEYLRLSYQGMRAKNKAFNASIQTHFDEGIGSISVVPQDIGRVLLNLYNNAFYAVQEKTAKLNGSFEPVVSVSTLRDGNNIVIVVKDNGTGVPEQIAGKIFQPFFTTKPTGEGTGLGLSLSYDIVTKGHGGELRVVSEEGEGTAFEVQLPVL